MTASWAAVLFAAAWPPAWGGVTYWLWRDPLWAFQWATSGAGMALLFGFLSLAIPGSSLWAGADVGALNYVLGVFLWWFNRRRRDKARAWLGQKWRSLLAALVRTMHERSRSRPVLRPVPGGAR